MNKNDSIESPSSSLYVDDFDMLQPTILSRANAINLQRFEHNFKNKVERRKRFAQRRRLSNNYITR